MKQGKRRLLFITSLLLAALMGLMMSHPVKAASVSKIKWSNVSSKKTLWRGYKQTFKVKITPTSAAKAKLVWSSSKKSVATVSSKGIVTPKKNGVAYITCKVKAKPSKKVRCKVTVKTKKATKVTFPKSYLSLQVGKYEYVKGTVSPSNTYNKKLKYTTSNSKIATVSSSGKVTGKSVGTTTIKATTTDGSKKYKTYKVRVVKVITKSSTDFIAHRGLSSVAPENTLRAYQLAGAAGFWGAEADIRMTKDREFILLHDATFKRMCGVDKKPEDMSLAEIKQLKVISGNEISKYKTDELAIRIPTLKEYLEVCKTYNMVPVIELKMEYAKSGDQTYTSFQDVVKNDMKELHTKVKSVMGTSKYKYIAYDLETLLQLNEVVHAEEYSNVSMEHVVNYPSTGMINFYRSREIGLDCQYDNLSSSMLKSFSDAGVKTNVWTIDDAGTVWDYINGGVSNITTNKKFW